MPWQRSWSPGGAGNQAGLDVRPRTGRCRAFSHPAAERPAQALTNRDPHPVKLDTPRLAVYYAAFRHLAKVAARNASHASGEAVLPLRYVTGALIGGGGWAGAVWAGAFDMQRGRAGRGGGGNLRDIGRAAPPPGRGGPALAAPPGEIPSAFREV
ncbi:MAG: hypothetical protein JRN33_02325 [Nitrososphaerota archaeon]|nr:hypothetical protein [Nitrososphaerota archaeon]